MKILDICERFLVPNDGLGVIPSILKVMRRSYIIPKESNEDDRFFILKSILVILSMNVLLFGSFFHLFVNLKGNIQHICLLKK